MSPTAKRGRASCLKHPRKIWEDIGPLSYSFYSLSSSHYLMQLLQHTPFLFKLFSSELRTNIYFIFKIQLMCKKNSKLNIVYDFHIIFCFSQIINLLSRHIINNVIVEVEWQFFEFLPHIYIDMLLPKEDAAVPVMDFEQLHEKIDDKDKAIILLWSLPPTFIWAFGHDLNLPQRVHQKWW
jgi:hypothetical protein